MNATYSLSLVSTVSTLALFSCSVGFLVQIHNQQLSKSNTRFNLTSNFLGQTITIKWLHAMKYSLKWIEWRSSESVCDSFSVQPNKHIVYVFQEKNHSAEN